MPSTRHQFVKPKHPRDDRLGKRFWKNPAQPLSSPCHASRPNRSSTPEPSLGVKDLANHLLGVQMCLHSHFLTMRLPLDIVLFDTFVCSVLGQTSLVSRNAALHTTSNNSDDMHTQGRYLNAKCCAIRMQGGFGSIIDGAPRVRDAAGHRTDLDDRAPRMAKERHKCLTEPHNGEEVGGKDGLDFGVVGFNGWDSVVWVQSITTLNCIIFVVGLLASPSIVDQVIQSPSRSLPYLVFTCINTLL